jgi:hypothetical protein
MANFPLITWEVTLPPLTVSVSGGAAIPVTPAPGYGFGLDDRDSDIASDDSIPGRLCTALQAALGGVLPQATYQFTANTVPATSPLLWTIYTAYGSPIVLDFGTVANAAVYGFDGLTFSISSGVQSTQTTFNLDGVWVPCGVAGDLRRTTVQRAAASSSEMSGLSTDVVNWGQVANLEFLSSIFPAANLTRWYASIDPYYTAAGRLKFDPNNTLEGLLEAASTGVTFRLYRQAADAAGTTPYTYNEARMPMISEKSSAADYAQADDEPRLWSTTGMFFRGNI